PYQWVTAANAGWYSTAAWASPASIHAAVNHTGSGAAAIPTTASVPSAEPAVITGRGPSRSSSRPTGTPATAETASPAQKAPIAVAGDHPVSAVRSPSSTGNA